jgi:hypothetical protein
VIFDLVQDFTSVLKAIPAHYLRRRVLMLLIEAIRRDVHFVNRHPTTLFQCLWNSCWWYDCPQAAEFVDGTRSMQERGPWARHDSKLSDVMDNWLCMKASHPGLVPEIQARTMEHETAFEAHYRAQSLGIPSLRRILLPIAQAGSGRLGLARAWECLYLLSGRLSINV